MLRLGIDPETLFRATFICQDGLCFCNMALISFRLFRKNLGNLRDFFGQMVYRPRPPPPMAKNFPYSYGHCTYMGSTLFSKTYTVLPYCRTQSFVDSGKWEAIAVLQQGEEGLERSAFSMWNSALHSAESMLSRLNGSYCW